MRENSNFPNSDSESITILCIESLCFRFSCFMLNFGAFGATKACFLKCRADGQNAFPCVLLDALPNFSLALLKQEENFFFPFAFAFFDANINSLNAATAIPGCCAVSWQHLLNMTRTTYILADLAYFFVFAASGARFAGETSLSREVPLPELT